MPLGTILTVGPQRWRHDIPDSKPIAVEYRRAAWAFDFNPESTDTVDTDGFTIYVDLNGILKITRFEYQKEDITYHRDIGQDSATNFINDMLRCVAGVDCYFNARVGGIGSSFKILFEDGTILEYPGEYRCGDCSDEDIVNNYMVCWGENYQPWY